MTKFTVKHDAALLAYMIEVMPEKSRTTLKSYLSHRRILVNGKLYTAFDTPVRRNDEIQILDVGVEPQNPNNRLRIIFEDEHIIIIEKKNGLLSMSTGKAGEQTAYTILNEHVRRRKKDARVFIVHRLDRDTSGLILFAKSEDVQQTLQTNWNDNVIERKYVAVVEGELPKKEDTIISWLTENPKSLKMMSSPKDNGGKKAITRYKLLKSNGKYSLVELELETGRKNQIRVQMASIGCPVAGDKKYGAVTNPLGRVCLHAQTLAFRHPVTGERLRFDTGIPQTFN